MIEDDSRIDEPPYEIERPDRDDWNDEFLGEGMPAEPSLPFDLLEDVALADPLLPAPAAAEFRGGIAVRLVADERERDAVFDLEAGGTRARLEAVDLGERVLVVVESGYGSGRVAHRWRRVEAVDGGVHLHGYYTAPQMQTHDLVSRRSVLAVDRPDGGPVRFARASLTLSPDRRIHADSREGLVAFGRGSGRLRRR